MTKSPLLPVNAKVLVWARESIGLSEADAASLLRTGLEQLRAWENGSEQPSVVTLREMATKYRRPLSALLLAEPRAEKGLPDLRTGAHKKELGPKSHLAIRRARYLQDRLRELGENGVSGELVPDPSIKHAEEKALEERERLGVPADQHGSTFDPYRAFDSWRSEIEARGIFVFQEKMPLDEVRGFCLVGKPQVIVVNRSDHIRSRLFTLFHEYAHIIIGSSGLCNTDAGLRSAEAHHKVEEFCNRFAGAAMLPEDKLSENEALVFEFLSQGSPPPDEAFTPLTSRFRVTKPVLWYRLLQVGRISQQEFSAKWTQWAAQPRPPKGDGGPHETRALRAIRERGARFVNTVLAAQESRSLTEAEAVDYLNVRIGDIDKLASHAG